MLESAAGGVLAHLVATWISIVSGAFDQVTSRRLLRKVHANGVPEDTQEVNVVAIWEESPYMTWCIEVLFLVFHFGSIL